MEVYKNAIEQVFGKIQKDAWVGNDALLVKLNYNPTYYNSFTEFRKEGFEYNNKIFWIRPKFFFCIFKNFFSRYAYRFHTSPLFLITQFIL